MFRHLIFGLILTSIFSCKSNIQTINNSNKVDTSLKILIYGLLDREQFRAMNTVAKKYNFHYYPVGGCVISKHLSDSVNKENKKVYEILVKKFGKNWRSTFADEVDTPDVSIRISKLL